MIATLSTHLHRWLSLLFALPLVLIILSGLVLSVEPLLKASTPEGLVTEARLRAAIERVGPLVAPWDMIIRGYDGTVSFGDRVFIDLASGEPVPKSRMAHILDGARALHTTLLLDLGWLVGLTSTALVAILLLGLLAGRPWAGAHRAHRRLGWVLLPLLLAPPLTGFALSQGLWRPARPPYLPGPVMPHADNLARIAAAHDLRQVEAIREDWGASLVERRDDDGGLLRDRIGPAAQQRFPTNWLRLLHEGRWGGGLGAAINLLAALALAVLLVGGLAITARLAPLRWRDAARARRQAAEDDLRDRRL